MSTRAKTAILLGLLVFNFLLAAWFQQGPGVRGEPTHASRPDTLQPAP